MRRYSRKLCSAAILLSVALPASGSAAEFTNGATGAYLGGSASSAWYPGGNHWRGHYSTLWRNRDPNHLYTTPGWGGPWFYTPRTYYEPYRPQVIMPPPVVPSVVHGPPEPWTAQWYAYCSDRFRSFEPSTGFYTTYSGGRRMCW